MRGGRCAPQQRCRCICRCGAFFKHSSFSIRCLFEQCTVIIYDKLLVCYFYVYMWYGLNLMALCVNFRERRRRCVWVQIAYHVNTVLTPGCNSHSSPDTNLHSVLRPGTFKCLSIENAYPSPLLASLASVSVTIHLPRAVYTHQ